MGWPPTAPHGTPVAHPLTQQGPAMGHRQRRQFNYARRAYANSRRFFLLEANMNARSKLLVVGHGMVGHRFLESLPADAPFDVTVLCQETRPAYDRVQLSSYFSGKSAEDLSLVEPTFFARRNLQLRLGEHATQIDKDTRTVLTSSGDE